MPVSTEKRKQRQQRYIEAHRAQWLLYQREKQREYYHADPSRRVAAKYRQQARRAYREFLDILIDDA